MVHERIAWVDHAKGICILLVVMMHATLGYGELVHSQGWMHAPVAFAQPFRMPDFFLVAGLFLSRSLFGPGRDYFDRKVIHFAYFYLIWLAIQTIIFEADLILSDPVEVIMIYLKALVIPASSLWFIHMLAVFYIVTRLVRHAPKLWVFMGAAALQVIFSTGLINTGWSVTNRFAEWYVFFFVGYAAAPFIFSFAQKAAQNLGITALCLLAWMVGNGVFVIMDLWHLPIVRLALGLCGAAAIVALSAQFARTKWSMPLGYVGRYSIVVYLTFFLPMKAAQVALARTGLIPDVGLASFIVFIAAVALPLIFHAVIRKTPLMALYERPTALKLRKTPAKAALEP